MDEKLRRILSWAKGIPAPPYFIEYRVTCKCNLRCRYCDRKTHDKGHPDLNKKETLNLIEQAYKLGIKEWDIVGFGEPMYQKELTTLLLEKIKQKNMFGTMTTNGTMFDEKSIKRIVKSGWNGITVSIDSSDAKIHDLMRGEKGTFDKIAKNLKLFEFYKQRFETKSPSLNFQVIIHRKNFDKLSEIVLLASELGVQAVLYQPLIVHSNPIEQYRLQEGDIQEFQKEIIKIKQQAKKFKIMTNIHEYEDMGVIFNSNDMVTEINKESNKYMITNPFLRLSCFEPWYMMAVRNEGSVVPCYHIMERYENIKKKSLKDIWYGTYFNQIRERIKNQQYFLACQTCCPRGFIDNRNFRKHFAKIKTKEPCIGRRIKQKHPI